MLDGRIQQIGTPMDLYDRPVNRFIATFVGTINLIEGTIETGGRFVADGIALPAIGGEPGRACISVRPQDISVAPPDGGIPARIAEREFLGNITRYHTQAGMQSIVVDVPYRRGTKAHDVGETIGLGHPAIAGIGAALVTWRVDVFTRHARPTPGASRDPASFAEESIALRSRCAASRLSLRSAGTR